MNEKILEIRQRAKEIMGNEKISILADEKNIMEILNKTSNTNGDNINYEESLLEGIEQYLFEKEQLKLAKEDMKFLKELANELRGQETRKTDISEPPLFVITNSNGEDTYFITRNSANEFKKYNSNYKKIIEIPSSNSPELSKLLEIIKRKF